MNLINNNLYTIGFLDVLALSYPPCHFNFLLFTNNVYAPL